MNADIEKGFAPDEALQVVLTEEDKQKYGIKTRLSMARFLKKYVATRNLPYIIQSFKRREGDYVVVRVRS